MDADANAANTNGGGGGAEFPDSSDSGWMTDAADTLRELTVGPLMTGMVQGFVSVALRRRRERREAAEKAKAEEEALDKALKTATDDQKVSS